MAVATKKKSEIHAEKESPKSFEMKVIVAEVKENGIKEKDVQKWAEETLNHGDCGPLGKSKVSEITEVKTRKEVVEFIRGSEGKMFSIRFIKRTDGSEREMVCRTGVKSRLAGGEPAYDPKDYKLINVFDMHAPAKKGSTEKGDYRSIPIEGIIQIKMEGKWFKVV